MGCCQDDPDDKLNLVEVVIAFVLFTDWVSIGLVLLLIILIAGELQQ